MHEHKKIDSADKGLAGLRAGLGEAALRLAHDLRSAIARLCEAARTLVRDGQLKLGLRTHLVVFGLAIVVPILLLSAFILHRYTLAERAANEQWALATARGLSADIDREITAVVTTLEALSTSRALISGDFMAFHVQALEALRSRPSWNVVLIDKTRQQLVNTRLPIGSALPKSRQPDAMSDIVLQTKKPVISDLFRGTVARRLIFAVGVPVKVGDDVPYALIMSLDPERLVELIQSVDLPDGWFAAVADSKNITMAHSDMLQRYVGQPIPEEALRLYGDRPEGVITTSDLEGRRSLQAFHLSKVTGWRIAAWAPVSHVEAPLRQAWNTFLLSGAALLGLSLLLAVGAGRLMSAPIAELMAAGTALGHSKPVKALSTTLREADELSMVLANAAKELEARTGAQARLATIVSFSPSAMISLSPEGIIQTWNPAAEELFGYAPAEVIGKHVAMFYDRNDIGEFSELNDDIRSGQAVHRDGRRKHKDGRLLDVSISVAPMLDDAGRLMGISSIVSDIGERKAREHHIEFLMRELSHRSKNLLAVVQAVAGQTARHSDDMDDFQTRFSQRLHAMARAQDLLVARNWEGAQLCELVRAQLAPFADEASDRIETRGPDIDLRPDAVHGLTLALHELATNAAKYGALSNATGKVVVTWDLDAKAADGGRFSMRWRERGGPAVAPPERKGFGHVVIADMAASALRGEVELEFDPAGVRWSLMAPASGIIKRVSAPATGQLGLAASGAPG